MKSNVLLVIMVVTTWSFDGMAVGANVRSRKLLQDNATTVAQASSSQGQGRRLAAPLRRDTSVGAGVGTAMTSTQNTGSAAAPSPATPATAPSRPAAASSQLVRCEPGEIYVPAREGSPAGCTPISPKDLIENAPITQVCGRIVADGTFEHKAKPECIAFMESKGPCAPIVKEARDDLQKFHQACADAGYSEGLKCMNEAYLCTQDMARETKDSDPEEIDAFKALFGVTKTKRPASEKKCSLLDAKDYQTEKRERGRNLRNTRRELEQLSKDLKSDAKDAVTQRTALQKDLVQVQTDLRQNLTAEQKEQAEQTRAMQSKLSEIEDQKAALRAETFTMRAESAVIVAERAHRLAELSDATIAATCTAEIEKLIASWKVNMSSGGLSGQTLAYGEKKRRVDAKKTECYAKAEATRVATYATYRAKLDAVTNRADEQNRRIKALDQEKSSLATSNQEALVQASRSQQQANAEAYQKQQAILLEMNELQKAQSEREIAGKKQISDAEQDVENAVTDIADLGKPPKGTKAPTAASSAFSNLRTSIQAMDPLCLPQQEKMLKSLKDGNLLHYYENGLSAHPDLEYDDDDEGTR